MKLVSLHFHLRLCVALFVVNGDFQFQSTFLFQFCLLFKVILFVTELCCLL
jgi:hypothetical protein